MGIGRIGRYLLGKDPADKGEKINRFYSDDAEYDERKISRRGFLKFCGVAGSAALGFGAGLSLRKAYAALIKDLAIFDFDVSCQDCAPEQKKMGGEIADKLAFYLRRNMSDVHIYRLKGYHHYAELPGNINADGCIGGNLLLDSGNAVLSAEYGDTFLIDIGNKSYRIPTHESQLDNTISELANRITRDLDDQTGGDFFKKFFGDVPQKKQRQDTKPKKRQPIRDKENIVREI